MAPSPPKALYTIPELAGLAGVSRQALGRLIAKNGVDVIRSGRRVFVPLSSLRTMAPLIFEAIAERMSLAVDAGDE